VHADSLQPPQTDRSAEREAWLSHVYRAHVAYVSHTLRRLGVPDRERSDLAQDVFVFVHRHQDGYDTSRPLRPWLFGIAFRIARRHADKHAQRFEVLVDTLEPYAGEALDGTEALVEKSRARVKMNAALRALDSDKRTAFLLCEIEGLSVVEAAAIADENVNTMHARLRAARQQLAAALLGAESRLERGGT